MKQLEINALKNVRVKKRNETYYNCNCTSRFVSPFDSGQKGGGKEGIKLIDSTFANLADREGTAVDLAWSKCNFADQHDPINCNTKRLALTTF